MKRVASCILVFLLLVLAAKLAFGADVKQVPNTSPAAQAEAEQTLEKFIGKKEGLEKLDTPKFFFAGGLLISFAWELAKFAVAIAIVAVVVYYVRRRKADPDSDIVDTLVAAFDDLVDRLRSERDKRQAEVAKFDARLNRLQKRVSNAVRRK